jgi:hypothetical protein
MGSWYTIGLALGIGIGFGVIFSALVGANTVGVGIAAVTGTCVGLLFGLAVGETAETVAGGAGGLLGALSAAAVVLGSARRGATRLGIAIFVGIGGVLIALLGLIPLVGYVEAVVLPLLALRMRGRQAARFAGLRTLAK